MTKLEVLVIGIIAFGALDGGDKKREQQAGDSKNKGKFIAVRKGPKSPAHTAKPQKKRQ